MYIETDNCHPFCLSRIVILHCCGINEQLLSIGSGRNVPSYSNLGTPSENKVI